MQLTHFSPNLLVAILLLPTNFSARDPNPFARGKGTNLLTNVAIKALKPTSKPYKKADGGGLFIFVQPNGSKAWRPAYRFDGNRVLHG